MRIGFVILAATVYCRCGYCDKWKWVKFRQAFALGHLFGGIQQRDVFYRPGQHCPLPEVGATAACHNFASILARVAKVVRFGGLILLLHISSNFSIIWYHWSIILNRFNVWVGCRYSVFSLLVGVFCTDSGLYGSTLTAVSSYLSANSFNAG